MFVKPITPDELEYKLKNKYISDDDIPLCIIKLSINYIANIISNIMSNSFIPIINYFNYSHSQKKGEFENHHKCAAIIFKTI